MSNDLIRVLLAIVVLAHGIGHVLFAPQVQSVMRVPATGNSWLLTGALGKGLTDVVATAVALGLVVAFSVAAFGLFTQAAWWRSLLIAASAISIGLIALFWDGLPTSSAFFAITFDAAALVALLVLHWPSEATVGA
jgi:hypothetical protein